MKIKSEDYIEEVEDISSYRTLQNKVLVKQLVDNTIKEIGGVEIVFPTHVRVGKVAARHSIRYGEVIIVPEKFVKRGFGKDATRWDTEIEVLPGDIVWCRYTAFLNAERFTDGEHIYYVIDYQELVVAKRDGDVIMLNGFVLVDVVKKEQSQILITERKETSMGVVKYNGSNNKSYTYPKYEDADIEVGDAVYMNPASFHKLEDDLWKAFGEELYFIQKCHILGKK